MSTLSVPRLYFKGAATWNPGTANNNDYWPVYDFSRADLNWTHLQNYGITKENAREKFPEYARSLCTAPFDPDDPEKVVRACPAEWNYYGGMEWWLHSADQQTVITGGQTSLGGKVVTDDPVVGAVLDVVGDPFPGTTFDTPPRMVDNDPASYWCTNFLLRRFHLGTRSAPERFLVGTLEEDAPCMTSRWLTMNRNLNLDPDGHPVVGDGVGGAILQACLRTEHLQWDPDESSPLLKALQDGLKQPNVRGLMIRLSAYLSHSFNLPAFKDIPVTDTNARYAALAELWDTELASGRVPSANPSVATVVGAIGLWHEDELRSSPGGRVLFWQDPCSATVSHDGAENAWLGPVFAELQPSGSSDPTHLSLDLGNAVPEVSSTGDKYVTGPLRVRVVSFLEKNARTTVFAEIPADDIKKSGYELRAGIVDLPLPNSPGIAEKIRSGFLLVSAHPPGGPLAGSALVERPVIVETDDRSVYLDQGETGTMTLQVRERGNVPTRDITVRVRQYLASPLPPDGGQQWQLSDTDDHIVELKEQTVTVKAGTGQAEISFTANLPGSAVLAFFSEGERIPPYVYPVPDLTPDHRITTASASFGCVRVLSFDDDLPQRFSAAYTDSNFSKDAAWQWLYENVLRVYDLLYPAMKYYAQLDLGDSATVEKNIDQIVQLCDPSLRSSTVYMPVSRELSTGKRNVLKSYQWLVNNNWPRKRPPELLS